MAGGTVEVGWGNFGWKRVAEEGENRTQEGVALQLLCSILTPNPGPGNSTQAFLICDGYVAGTDPRCPIGTASALLRVG